MTLSLSSTAFESGYKIPVVHTCDGDDISPPLSWDGEPKATRSFAIIMEDPDAPGGTFTHWMIYNIPPDTHKLDKAVPIKINLDLGAVQVKNDFGKIGYGGPCPPKGEEHRYFFKIFALKKKFRPQSIQNEDDFYRLIKGHVLEKAEYMGKYYRKT